MKTTFDFIRTRINSYGEGTLFTVQQLRKECRDYFQQTIPISTISNYVIRLLGCDYIHATDMLKVYRVAEYIPDDCTASTLELAYYVKLKEKKKSATPALDIQIGGSHYKKYSYQPVELTVDAKLSYIQGAIIKYIVRYKDKNGQEDLEKAMHYAQLALDLKHKPKYLAFQNSYLHRFCVENKLDELQSTVVKHTVRSEFAEIVKIIKNI